MPQVSGVGGVVLGESVADDPTELYPQHTQTKSFVTESERQPLNVRCRDAYEVVPRPFW